MGYENVYAYNNLIVTTAATIVTLLVFLMTFIFLMLLLRRRRLEKRRQRAENLANINDGHVPHYMHTQPHRLEAINEDTPRALREVQITERLAEDEAKPAVEELLSTVVETEQVPSPLNSSAQYHFNFSEQKFPDSEQPENCDAADRVIVREQVQISATQKKDASWEESMEVKLKAMDGADADSDYDATFETTAS